MSFFVTVFLIAAIILFIITIFLCVNVYKKNRKYIQCTGEIIDFEIAKSTMHMDYRGYQRKIWPIISYTIDGINYTYKGNFYSTNMRVGTKVTVFCHKEDFSKASMKGFVYFAPLITGGIAIVFMIPIIILFILKSNGIISF
mgnify:FL=1